MTADDNELLDALTLDTAATLATLELTEWTPPEARETGR